MSGKMMQRFTLAAALALFAGFTARSEASLVTSAGAIPSPSATVDFSQFSGNFVSTGGPVQIGGLVGEDIVWTSTNGNAEIGNNGYGLGTNGGWTSGRDGYTGLNTATGDMIYTFNSGLVSAVGGFINYAPGSGPDVTITALDSMGNVLESYDINALAPIFTPLATNAGAFRGISRATADIKAFVVSNSYVVLDNLKFSRNTATTPEPSTLASFGIAALIGLGYGVRRRVRAV